MYIVNKNSGAFGANDVFAYKSCDGEMTLTLRAPRPKLGIKYEEQQFTCGKCGHEASRSVDENGH